MSKNFNQRLRDAQANFKITQVRDRIANAIPTPPKSEAKGKVIRDANGNLITWIEYPEKSIAIRVAP
jgi:hypothetical protein